MSQKKIDLASVVQNIESVVKQRISKEPVVPMGKFQTKKEKVILLIDDDPLIIRSVEKAMAKEGFRVRAAQDPLELTGTISKGPIDFIILDIGLPWMDGYELAEHLKESRELENIPMIFLSGFNEDEDLKKGFKAGAHDYLTKPFEVKKLIKTVRTLIELNED